MEQINYSLYEQNCHWNSRFHLIHTSDQTCLVESCRLSNLNTNILATKLCYICERWLGQLFLHFSSWLYYLCLNCLWGVSWGGRLLFELTSRCSPLCRKSHAHHFVDLSPKLCRIFRLHEITKAELKTSLLKGGAKKKKDTIIRVT